MTPKVQTGEIWEKLMRVFEAGSSGGPSAAAVGARGEKLMSTILKMRGKFVHKMFTHVFQSIFPPAQFPLPPVHGEGQGIHPRVSQV